MSNSSVISKNEFRIFVSGGKSKRKESEQELLEWQEQKESNHSGWYDGVLLESGESRVLLDHLLESEKIAGENGLAVIATKPFSVNYLDSNSQLIQIIGELPQLQLDPHVIARPQQSIRVPLIFPSNTTVSLVIKEEQQVIKLVNITKL